MGCFSISCGLTRQPLREGDRVVACFITGNSNGSEMNCYAHDMYKILSTPFELEMCDYGGSTAMGSNGDEPDKNLLSQKSFSEVWQTFNCYEDPDSVLDNTWGENLNRGNLSVTGRRYKSSEKGGFVTIEEDNIVGMWFASKDAYDKLIEMYDNETNEYYIKSRQNRLDEINKHMDSISPDVEKSSDDPVARLSRVFIKSLLNGYMDSYHNHYSNILDSKIEEGSLTPECVERVLKHSKVETMMNSLGIPYYSTTGLAAQCGLWENGEDVSEWYKFMHERVEKNMEPVREQGED